jgi:hypothetical protein
VYQTAAGAKKKAAGGSGRRPRGCSLMTRAKLCKRVTVHAHMQVNMGPSAGDAFDDEFVPLFDHSTRTGEVKPPST